MIREVKYNKNFITTVAMCERESAYKIFDFLTENKEVLINDDFIYLEFYEDNIVKGNAIYVKSTKFLCGLFVYSKYRNNGIATKIFNYCLSKYGNFYFSTRQTEVKKIVKKFNYKFIKNEMSDWTEQLEDTYEVISEKE